MRVIKYYELLRHFANRIRSVFIVNSVYTTQPLAPSEVIMTVAWPTSVTPVIHGITFKFMDYSQLHCLGADSVCLSVILNRENWFLFVLETDLVL